METIDTTFLRRCIASLEQAVEGIERQEDGDDVMYDIYRAACAKEFELVLEQSGKLLRKRLAAWFASNRQADRLHFKDLFRQGARPHDRTSGRCLIGCACPQGIDAYSWHCSGNTCRMSRCGPTAAG